MLHFLYSLVVAVIVYLVGCAFDKTPSNKYAGLVAFGVFVLVFLGFAFVG